MSKGNGFDAVRKSGEKSPKRFVKTAHKSSDIKRNTKKFNPSIRGVAKQFSKNLPRSAKRELKAVVGKRANRFALNGVEGSDAEEGVTAFDTVGELGDFSADDISSRKCDGPMPIMNRSKMMRKEAAALNETLMDNIQQIVDKVGLTPDNVSNHFVSQVGKLSGAPMNPSENDEDFALFVKYNIALRGKERS